jgi:hypothetical protein
LTLDNEGIVGYIESLDKETKAIKTEALKFCWYMRGGLSYDDALMLSTAERDIIGKIIKDNLETTKESGLPFF